MRTARVGLFELLPSSAVGEVMRKFPLPAGNVPVQTYTREAFTGIFVFTSLPSRNRFTTYPGWLGVTDPVNVYRFVPPA